MIHVVAQMGLLIVIGLTWRWLKPGGLAADELRRYIAGLVYWLLLPALVISVLWRAPLGLETVRLASTASLTVAMCLLASWGVGRLLRLDRPRLGAFMLASAFPNAIYLGLPVMDATFGPLGTRVALQFDTFGVNPMLFTVGILIAAFYGVRSSEAGPAQTAPMLEFFKVPALWAAVLAAALNLGGIAPNAWLLSILERLGQPVPALMLLALGMGLRLGALTGRSLVVVLPAVLIQLLLMPLLGWWLTGALGLEGEVRHAAVLLTAMPTMVLGIVICDRFGLHTATYAAAATLSTGLSLLTLPLWHQLLAHG